VSAPVRVSDAVRMNAPARVSARLRLALSYAVFLVAAGAVVLFGIYLVLRYVPDYPLMPANPQSDPALPVASRGEILQSLVGMSGVLLLFLAVVGVVGGWILAGWILKPLHRINEAVVVAGAGNLQHRIHLAGRNDEFRQLADSFDHMLDRLDDAFAVQERFAANASHELRTPLAITATMLDVAHRNPGGHNYPELVERLRLTNDRAIGLTESLLRLADANAITAAASSTDLAEISHASIAEHTVEAAQREVTITEKLEPAPLMGDEALLTQLVSNLVQNAIRHGGNPGWATVSTRFDRARGVAVLRVESTGDVISAETAARLTEPFLRGAGRVAAGGTRGYGLGLALVERIVTVHNGTLTIVPRVEGGLDVSVEIPAPKA
jgi:two-component system, OmpR family, sensor histidine kinase VanS